MTAPHPEKGDFREKVRPLVADTTWMWERSQSSKTIDLMTDKFVELFSELLQQVEANMEDVESEPLDTDENKAWCRGFNESNERKRQSLTRLREQWGLEK